MAQGPQMQMTVPFTRAVKWLIIVNVSIWLVFQVIIEQFFLSEPLVTVNFGLVPMLLTRNLFMWQPFTYMFLHDASGVMHIVFNMLLLWWLGAELEGRWGTRFFLLYYFVCGVGAAVLYTTAVTLFVFLTGGHHQTLMTPVVGASGAIFGLMLAYGIIFGERVVSFMFLFPMKAKYFVLILAGIEAVMVINAGISGGQTANLAHLGGFISGFLFLFFWTRWQRRKLTRVSKSGKNSNLRLVVDNEKEAKPRIWH